MWQGVRMGTRGTGDGGGGGRECGSKEVFIKSSLYCGVVLLCGVPCVLCGMVCVW